MPKSIISKQKFINQWLRHFAGDVNKDKLKQYVADQYIWHVFSFELLDKGSFLIGDSARQAYDNADKNDCIFCDMFGRKGVTDKLQEEYCSAAQIDTQIDELYVVAKDNSWTYIKTHESRCGPYFVKSK